MNIAMAIQPIAHELEMTRAAMAVNTAMTINAAVIGYLQLSIGDMPCRLLSRSVSRPPQTLPKTPATKGTAVAMPLALMLMCLCISRYPGSQEAYIQMR